MTSDTPLLAAGRFILQESTFSILKKLVFKLLIQGCILFFWRIPINRFYGNFFGRCLERKRNIPVYSYRIVNTFPHDREAFTQGLVYDRGVLYEGQGFGDDQNSENYLFRVVKFSKDASFLDVSSAKESHFTTKRSFN